MFILIFTVFIAELIIMAAIVSVVLKANRCVISVNNQVADIKSTLETALIEIKNGVKTSKEGVDNAISYLKIKRKEYSKKIIQNIILYIFVISCKGRYKNAAIFFQLAVAIRDYIRDARA